MTDDFYSKKPPVGGDKDNPMREPRFSEIATFMRAPLAESLDNVDTVSYTHLTLPTTPYV